MSSKHSLTVRTFDPTTEIAIYDARFNRVARAVGRHYTASLDDGLYEVRIRTAGGRAEKLVSLASDETVEFEPITFATPVPLSRTASSDEAHQKAVTHASANPRKLGEGSALLVVVRDRSRSSDTESGQFLSPASGLSLIGPDGTHLLNLDGDDTVERSGRSAVGAIQLSVNPGIYRLRLTSPDKESIERSLVASPGWSTQCFMVRRIRGDDRLADLSQGSISLRRLGESFGPDDALTRLAETARDALASDRRVTDAAAQALMECKFEDPMLGLFVGHLLLRDQMQEPHLDQVVANLIRLLGPAHPDVQALALATSRPERPSVVSEMPMLRASWDVIVTRTVEHPGLVPAHSPAGRNAMRVRARVPWLVWDAAETLVPRRGDPKMAALRNYLNRDPDRSRLMRQATEVVTRAFEAPASFTPFNELSREDREELTRSLGVPNYVLDEMLSRLNNERSWTFSATTSEVTDGR